MEEQEGSSDDKEEVRLTAADIPGAELSEPLEKHPVAALRWWLLCRGVIVPTSVRKKELIDRVKKAEAEGMPVVDVDGSYLYRKYKSLSDTGKHVSLPSIQSPPISGWTVLNSENYETLASSIPCVTPGLVYTYLACCVGHAGDGDFWH